MYKATGTVDGENLSEIAIHNFEKNRKIESPVGPNREKKTQCGTYLLLLKRSR